MNFITEQERSKIKKLLTKISQGSWIYLKAGKELACPEVVAPLQYRKLRPTDPDSLRDIAKFRHAAHLGSGDPEIDYNAEFTALAPDTIRKLLAENEALLERVEELEKVKRNYEKFLLAMCERYGLEPVMKVASEATKENGSDNV